MNALPPITIGLPVFNGAKYLTEAIESLRAQTFTDYELIISDNASTDSTEEIARAAASEDGRITYHRHDINGGGPANYNFVLGESRSEYFMWHAHDDLRDRRFLELAHGVMVTTSDVSVTFSRAIAIGPDGEELGLVPRPDDLIHDSADHRLRAVIAAPRPELVLFGLMRRGLLGLTGEHRKFKGGDRILVAEMALLGRFVELPDILFLNRDHPDRYTRMAHGPEAELARREWWDPSSAEIVMPRWRGLGAYIGMVWRHPLSVGQRVRCGLALGQSLLDNRMYFSKQLGREALGVVPAVVSKLVRSTSSQAKTRP